jgi:hypothetical protein
MSFGVWRELWSQEMSLPGSASKKKLQIATGLDMGTRHQRQQDLVEDCEIVAPGACGEKVDLRDWIEDRFQSKRTRRKGMPTSMWVGTGCPKRLTGGTADLLRRDGSKKADPRIHRGPMMGAPRELSDFCYLVEAVPHGFHDS